MWIASTIYLHPQFHPLLAGPRFITFKFHRCAKIPCHKRWGSGEDKVDAHDMASPIPHMNKIHSLILLAISAVLPSCVSVSKIKDEDRTKVRFASTRAAQVFYEAALLPHGPNHGTVCVGIGVQSPYSVRTKETGNVLFNKAVQTADANHNGLISESEAEKFAAAQPETDLLMSR